MVDAHRASGARSGSLVLGLIACAALAAGCAAHHAKHERQTDLDLIGELLAGHYDNQAQIAEDRLHGRPPHEALTLSIVQVHADEIGVRMFYLQEMKTGTRDIKLQRLLSVGITNDHVVATQWEFTDPPRWREGDTTPELFTALQPPDVNVMRGCGLSFKKEGTRFSASTQAGKCSPGVSSTGVLESLEMRLELTPDELALSSREVDGQGRPVTADRDDPYIRFHRSGS